MLDQIKQDIEDGNHKIAYKKLNRIKSEIRDLLEICEANFKLEREIAYKRRKDAYKKNPELVKKRIYVKELILRKEPHENFVLYSGVEISKKDYDKVFEFPCLIDKLNYIGKFVKK